MRRVWVHKAYSFQEAEDFDIKFWRKAGASARFAATWSMVMDYRKMKGWGSGQPRLRRTVQNIKRS
jgi:hypothetical protein